MLNDDVYQAHLIVDRNGQKTRHPAGRFMVRGGKIDHLEDYHGLLAQRVPEGPVTPAKVASIHMDWPDLSIASHNDIVAGHRLDHVPVLHLDDQLPRPAKGSGPDAVAVDPNANPQVPSVFHYTRVGHDAPHVLEVSNGAYTLDGNPMSHDEVDQVLHNVRTGAGRIRHAKLAEAVQKTEAALFPLEKMTPQEAWAHLDSLDGDEKMREAVATLRRDRFEDPMVPGIGNQYAYHDFRSKNLPGVYASIDVNDLKHLNDTQGHAAGDALIKAFGHAARTGADPQKVKMFRAGGDEFVMHAPDPQTAYSTMRAIRGHLDQVPPIGGVHKPTFSVGFGNDFETADKALYHAKAQKFQPGTKLRAHAPGSVPHLAHSLISGSEGPVPLDEPSTPPKLPEEPKTPQP